MIFARKFCKKVCARLQQKPLSLIGRVFLAHLFWKLNNLIMTEKNETTNSQIDQFTNLKSCIKARKAFKTPF